jgi:hypothetical protein
MLPWILLAQELAKARQGIALVLFNTQNPFVITAAQKVVIWGV